MAKCSLAPSTTRSSHTGYPRGASRGTPGTVKLLALHGRAGADNRAACHGPYHNPGLPSSRRFEDFGSPGITAQEKAACFEFGGFTEALGLGRLSAAPELLVTDCGLLTGLAAAWLATRPQDHCGATRSWARGANRSVFGPACPLGRDQSRLRPTQRA